ncbi:putative chromatin remodeling & transcriptional activation HMG family [Helianthus annuus]|uniref:Chromatin remodeling & transcriptional activation HMG family n=1 Tax=Helianthus annuus TaxID=4232 RepID=A0A9K3E883_HELAN|nr:putative chromatin remodeling & transcriptional activation HMG family [Helianthus annuus]KAJ0839678.1 putative chromatin remodeling & transcriptional activation HMG family [Helianthus annuus]
MREIGKACGEKWKTMTYEVKVQYYDVATEQRAEFEKALADYAKRKVRMFFFTVTTVLYFET